MTTRRDVMMGALAAATALGHYMRSLRANGGKVDPIQVVDHVHGLGGGGVQFTVPLDADLKKLRARLEQHRMFLQGDLDLLTRATNDLPAFEQALKNYKALGADCVRVVCFVGRRYETFTSLQQYKDWHVSAVNALDICLPIAERIGISLAMENHKDRAVDEEVEILQKYSSQHLGANVDSTPEQLDDRVSGRQTVGPAGRVVDLGGGVEAEPPEDRRGQVAGGRGVRRGVGTEPVAGTVDRSAPDAAARQEDGVAVRPVVAARVLVDLGRPAEFTHRHH